MTQSDKLREAAAAATQDPHDLGAFLKFSEALGWPAQTVLTILDERDALRARVKELEQALEPFAYIAEMDIGEDENDFDFYQVATRSNARPTVGMLRAARDTMEASDG